MVVFSEYQTILPGGYYQFNTIKLDANRDGTDDYIFSLGYWGSPGMGVRLHSSFSSEHDGALLLGVTTNDTVYARTVRTFSVDSGSGMIVAYTITQNDCVRRSEEYIPVNHTSVFHPLWLCEGNQIGGTEDNFQRGSATFVYADSWPPYTNIQNDTLWVSRSESRNDCYAAPDGVPVYVGIAMRIDGILKKGWIRYKLEGSAKITFEEMAFQR